MADAVALLGANDSYINTVIKYNQCARRREPQEHTTKVMDASSSLKPPQPVSESVSATVLPKPPKSAVLVRIYRFLAALCGFMVVWILIYPSSVLMEHSSFHRTSFLSLDGPSNRTSHNNNVVSSDLVMKYQGEYLVQAFHILPGALWAMLAPVQMHSQIRKHYRRSHTVLGYIFAVTSVSIGVGVFIIQHRGLSYENFYGDLEPLPVPVVHYFLSFLTLYFVGCMPLSLLYAVFRKDFHLHRQWMVRHVASGIWISLQRVILVLLSAVTPLQYTRQQQRLIFPLCGFVAIMVTIGLGEVAVHFLNQQQAAKIQRKMAKRKTN